MQINIFHPHDSNLQQRTIIVFIIMRLGIELDSSILSEDNL